MPDGRLARSPARTLSSIEARPRQATRVATQGRSSDIGNAAHREGRRVLLIAGPTASGKSALALHLAQRHRGTVINADAMAVYRDLRILTGRPTPMEEASVPHRLYGHVPAAEPYSVGHWLAEVGREIEAARGGGRMAIVVGGTGLYFKALTQGLSDIPAVPADVRERIRMDAKAMTPERLHARLTERDPHMAARLKPTDPQRIIRALEVLESSGRSLMSFQDNRLPPILASGEARGFFIAPDRGALRQAIDRRFDRMMEDGALEEVRRLGEQALDPTLPAMRALGVPQLLRALQDGTSIPEAVDRAKSQTRAYAKRQMTFARHQLPEFTWVEVADAVLALVPGQ